MNWEISLFFAIFLSGAYPIYENYNFKWALSIILKSFSHVVQSLETTVNELKAKYVQLTSLIYQIYLNFNLIPPVFLIQFNYIVHRIIRMEKSPHFHVFPNKSAVHFVRRNDPSSSWCLRLMCSSSA